MSRTNYANTSILKKMALDTGAAEYKNSSTQTSKSLITLTYVRDLQGAGATEEDEEEEETEKPTGTNLPTTPYSETAAGFKSSHWLNYARDTEGLGGKGNRMVNVSVQCDIKIAAAHYRQLQKHCIDLRIENERHMKQSHEL